MAEDNQASAESRWGFLDSIHNDYRDTARYNATVTDPSIIRYWDEDSSQSHLAESYNDIGGRGANHLANKINQILWPSTLPFVRYDINQATVIDWLLKQGVQDPAVADAIHADLQRLLAKREQLVKQEFETSGVRPLVEENTLHNIITGNGCLYIPYSSKEAPQYFNLNQIRLVRDHAGDPIEFLICQKLHRSSLPKEVRDWANSQWECNADATSGIPVEQDKLFTWGELQDDGKWEIHQEMKGLMVPDSLTVIPKKKPLPYVFLTGPCRHGEHYGHSHIEVSGGSKLLRNLEYFTKMYMKRTGMAARTKIRQSPGALTRPRELMRDDRGDFYVGNPDDYEFLDLGGMEGYQVTVATMQKLERDLGQVFLLYDAVRRDGERVTAYENSLAMGELQAGLGAFATSQQMGQQQIAALLTERIKGDLQKVAPLPDGLKELDVVVVTGLNAMSRQFEINKETQFVELVKQMYPEEAARYLKAGEHIRRIETQIGLPGESLVKTDEEVAQEQQQAQMAAMGQQAALAASQGQQPQAPQG